MTSLTLSSGNLVLQCNYDPGLVNALKASIPSTERAFKKDYNGSRNVWLIAPAHGKLVADLVAQYLGELVLVPQVSKIIPHTEPRILDIRYVGTTKDRGDGSRSAFGFCNGEWSVILPEEVLKTWFIGLNKPDAPADANTLYAVLCVQRAASDDEIRSAYRRLARQWHPDICKDSDAQEQFIRIHEAYKILSDQVKRERYNAGLALEASIGRNDDVYISFTNYRSPLRCGYVLAEGHEILGRFLVDKILDWQDIVDSQGRALVTSWPMGAQHFTEVWV